jgi:exodeoxyribonuclease V alpha subunit
VHRLLRLSPLHHTPFNARNPLPYDCVVVDESSMLDLGLAARLGAALNSATRLVLLGDAQQLAAVEHGVAFAALCENHDLLRGCYAALTQTWRFGADSQIGQLARAIAQGDGAAFRLVLQTENESVKYQVLSVSIDSNAIKNSAWKQTAALAARLHAEFAPFRATLAHASPAQCLAALAQFQVLCTVNGGPFGTVALNSALAALQAGQGADPNSWFHGRPVMVLQNVPMLGVANGDVGVVQRTADGTHVYFSRSDAASGVLRIDAAQLGAAAAVTHAYAITVHKAQGSEYEHVALVVPPNVIGTSDVRDARGLPVTQTLSRELLYTAVTRAKQRLTLFGDVAQCAAACGASVGRIHGLAARLARG